MFLNLHVARIIINLYIIFFYNNYTRLSIGIVGMSSSQFLMTQLFLFFGDHGMTMAGDHGGETPLETDSALLV